MPEDADPLERIRGALRAHLGVVAAQVDAATVFTREWRFLDEPERSAFRAERRRYEERWRDLLREAADRGALRSDLDVEAAVLLVLSAANWAYTWIRPGADTDELADRFFSILLDGVRGTRRDRRRVPPWARLLIVNPRASKVSDALVDAGRGRAAGGARGRPGRAGPGEATAIAREHERSVDAIYVLSGDGTYNEVLNGVTGDVPLGFLPGGGTSVLPRALGLGRDPVAAARRLTRAGRRPIGLGRVNGRRFSFNAGVGFDAELVRRIDANGRRPTGVARATSRSSVRRWRSSPRAAGAFPRRSRSRASVAQRSRSSRTATRTRTPGRLPVRVARGASFDLGLDLVAPVSVRARDIPRLLSRWPGGGLTARA